MYVPMALVQWVNEDVSLLLYIQNSLPERDHSNNGMWLYRVLPLYYIRFIDIFICCNYIQAIILCI